MNQPSEAHDPGKNRESEDGGRHARSTADDFIEYLVLHADTKELSQTYAELYQCHGEAFAAYLSLEPDQHTPANLASEFLNAYHGTYSDQAEFREEIKQTLGWVDAIATAMHRVGIPTGALEWNDWLIDQRLADSYDLIELDGVTYVFDK
ncbi:MAG: hypothetical protein LKF88_05975 [Microbacteriaceae bacterium]|nr:hypothetical protein [Microbacteriaceae bacterium]